MKMYTTIQELPEQDLQEIQGGNHGHTAGGCTPIITLYPQPTEPNPFSQLIA